MNNNFVHHEESDFFDVKKKGRQERKRALRLDRSKYKKSDQDQLQKRAGKVLPSLDLKQGIVVSIRPGQFFVDCEGVQYICVLRGAMKHEISKRKNLVIVGDRVYFEEMQDGSGAIVSVQERKSVLSRADHLSQQKEHFIAANVDQVFITVSTVDPPLRTTLIDRYLIAAAKGNLHPVIVCNKIDLLDDPEYDIQERDIARALLEECQSIYSGIGIDFIQVSAKSGAGLDELAEVMKDHISVFSGQSGSGKTSLINAITGRDLKVGKTVLRTRKGSHTTSHTQLLPLEGGGWFIDTPGIKSFGVWDLKEQDVRSYFSEINEMGAKCKFPDCRHLQEPSCAVLEAVEEGLISHARYASYVNLLEEVKAEHLRR